MFILILSATTGAVDDPIDVLEVRKRSASLGSQDSNQMQENGLTRCKRSASSGAINGSVNVMSLSLSRRLSDKRLISFPSNLDVVNEESDFKGRKSTVNRSSLSSESEYKIYRNYNYLCGTQLAQTCCKLSILPACCNLSISCKKLVNFIKLQQVC